MPRKPEQDRNLVFNVAMKVSGQTLDALEIIRRVTGQPAGRTVREAFEDQIAGLSSVNDRGYRAVRRHRSEASTKKILNLNAWCDNWIKLNPEDAGASVHEGE